MVSVAVRLHKTPGEILDLPIDEYALLLGYFQLESDERKSQEAKDRARSIARRR